MVMFPVIILLYAWWKRGRIGWSDLKKSAPFFAVSLALGLAVIACQRHGVGADTIPLGGFFSRMACVGTSLAFYFAKCFLPLELSPIYPQWQVNPPAIWQFIPWLALGVAICWLWGKRQGWGRHVLFGFGFFLVNLVPFVGIHTISFMRFGWVMDHFLYLPILGLIGVAVAALGQMNEKLSASMRPYAFGGIAVVAALLAFGSHNYAKIYLNSEKLWAYTIRHYPGAWPAHNNLGNVLGDAGRLPEAREQFEEALRINPGYPEAHNNLGVVLSEMGRQTEAIAQFEEALKLCPDLASAQDNLGKVRVMEKMTSAKK